MKTLDDDRWDISSRPHTKRKLEILRKCFDVWLQIWSAPDQQEWIANEWYVMDLFAGAGAHRYNGQIVSGSPLIFLESIAGKRNRLLGNCKIKLFLVDYTKPVFDCLKENIDEFLRDNPQVKDIVEVNLTNADCNEAVETIIGQMRNTYRHPLFVLIDPWGIKIKKTTVEQIVGLRNRKDIMFNYILEGVRRTSGIAKKAYLSEEPTSKEIKTIKTLIEFIGDDIDFITSSDREILEGYIDSVFSIRDMKVAACSMEYPDRNDILYYLLYASVKLTVIKIIMDIYDREIRSFLEEKNNGQLTFGEGFDRESTIMFIPKIREIIRK